jgi:bifunctional dethiobiotin synthetase / adenosylmethionine---8-amino-7-oxononanoate aminotransferase
MIEMQWLAHEHRTQEKIGSVIIEPILQCAGGMKFVDPLWQRAMMEVADSRSIPIIFDESTNGFYRLGVRTCGQIILRDPDIAIYSKLLTGGILPLSVVVTNKQVYEACLEDEFLYGNTFIANPLSCVSALQALSVYDSFQKRGTVSRTPQLLFNEDQVKRLSLLSQVKECFTLGSVLTITFQRNDEDDAAYAFNIVKKLEQNKILAGLNLINCIGDVVYIMVSPFTPEVQCGRIVDTVYKLIATL